MTKNERQHRIELYIRKMPSLPVTVTKVREVCDNPKTSPMDLYKVISLDPVLMGKVMKLINSAYYGISGKVTSLVRAIIMLGMNTVKNLALSTTVMGIMSSSNTSSMLNYTRFWQHSLCTGIAAKILAKETGKERNRAEEYFIAGMFHDIGKIPILSCFAEEYIKIMNYCDESSESLFKAENRMLGIDHSITGGMIADLWNLDEQIKKVITTHHDKVIEDEKFNDIIYTVAIADYFTNKNGFGFTGGCNPVIPDSDAFSTTGITLEMLEKIKESVIAELDKAKVFLDYKE